MHFLSLPDKRLLEELQNDIPLVSHPFGVIAQKLTVSEEAVLEIIKNLYSEKIIRNISAIINARKIGFRSALVAVKAGQNQIEDLSRRINAHPCVSHNYLRNHTYSIWFTLTAAGNKNLTEEAGHLLYSGNKNMPEYLLLQTIRTFKIGVNFRFSQKKYDNDNNKTPDDGSIIELSPTDKQVLNKLQDDLGIVSCPWKEVASSIHISEELLFERIRYLKKSGVVRRISATINHRKAGILFNAMCCYKIAEEQIISAGMKISEHPQVTHCYQRNTVQGKWEYPLFAMVHAESGKESEDIALLLAQQINCTDYLVLHSERELKKERVRFEI